MTYPLKGATASFNGYARTLTNVSGARCSNSGQKGNHGRRPGCVMLGDCGRQPKGSHNLPGQRAAGVFTNAAAKQLAGCRGQRNAVEPAPTPALSRAKAATLTAFSFGRIGTEPGGVEVVRRGAGGEATASAPLPPTVVADSGQRRSQPRQAGGCGVGFGKWRFRNFRMVFSVTPNRFASFGAVRPSS